MSLDTKPLRIGVIGAGQIIRRHALAYRTLSNLAELVAVADVDAKRANEAKDRYGFADTCGDYKDLLAREDIDCVSICTPAGTHATMAVDALEAGKHVLCEKPVATTLADADRIVDAASQSKATFTCVFQLRADPAFRRVRQMIEEGLIGKVIAARMAVRLRKSPSYYAPGSGRGSYALDGGGVVINQGIHHLDALLTFLGQPTEVSAAMGAFVHEIEAEDTLIGWVRFESGALATIECTTCSKRKEFLIEVLGEQAGMRLGGDPDAKVFDWRVDARGSAAKRALRSQGLKAVPKPKEPPKAAQRIAKLIAKAKRKEWSPPANWGHTPFVREFLTSARDGQAGPVPASEARRSLELCMALYESAREGRPIRLPLGEDSKVYRGMEAMESRLVAT